MKKNLVAFCCLFCRLLVFSQDSGISSDGKYLFATISKTFDLSDLTLVIQSTDRNWKKEIRISSGGNPIFSAESKKIYFQNADTLCTLELGTDNLSTIPNVQSFTLNENKHWLLYQTNDVAGIVLIDLTNPQRKTQYKDVDQYAIDKLGKVLFLLKHQDKVSSVQWVNLESGVTQTIWSSDAATIPMYSLDGASKQLAFIAQDTGGRRVNSIWYYKEGNDKAELIASNTSQGIDADVEIGSNKLQFSLKGRRISFNLKEKSVPKLQPNPKFKNLEIWSYLDPVLQSQQQLDRDTNLLRDYAASLVIADKKIVRFEQHGEMILDESGDYALVSKFAGDIYSPRLSKDYIVKESFWNKATLTSVFLISASVGSRTQLVDNIKLSANMPNMRISPGGNYITWYNHKEKNYFCYEISIGKWKNVTAKISVPWIRGDAEGTRAMYNSPVGNVLWMKNDQALMVRDCYCDLWLIDPKNDRQPICVTHKYGETKRLIFNNYSDEEQLSDTSKVYFRLTSRNSRDKEGYCLISLNGKSAPQILIPVGGKYNYLTIRKARSADIFIVTRSNESEPEQNFVTTNFKQFNLVTTSTPERRKGIKQQLLSWKTFEGSINQGRLEFPENFDSTKKYPVIFWVYEKNSYLGFKRIDEGNPCREWGYITFEVDIQHSLGDAGSKIYDCVVSGAKYISKLPFVDPRKFAITGQSFGGYETNYLVTHTNVFAAAWAQYGASNMISLAGIEDRDEAGYNNTGDGQYRTGVTLWERPDIMIKNSPVFYADRVVTPLLLCHNKSDNRVPFAQSIEMFKALRRLGKRVWLLAAPGNGHGGPWGTDGNVIMARQFLDHYLKGAPAPVWMTRGVPAKLQGQTLGTEYDTEIKTPGEGLLMDNEEALTPKQKQLLKNSTTINEDGRIINAKGKVNHGAH